jgi:diacylglycerol kinase (ATP)
MKPSNTGLRRIFKAATYSTRGFHWAWNHEAAFRQEICLVILMLPTAFYVNVSTAEKVLMVGSLFIVLIVELINSAIESAVDRISPDIHELSGAAKDMGSAAVLVSLFLVMFVWGVILLL